MTSKYPEIRIKDAWLLRENVSTHLNELWGKGKPLRSDHEYQEIVEAYRDTWQPVEAEILSAMQNMLGITFRQKIIDVYIAPWFHAFSDPLVIGVIFEPDIFVDTLTHELTHRLLTDNTRIPYQQNILLPEWQKIFGKNRNFTELAHIPVHAVCKAIYLDILKQPYRFERDVKNNEKFEATDYVNAWNYVNTNNYKEIIAELRKSYEALGKKYEAENE